MTDDELKKHSEKVLEEINSQPWYYPDSVCDDCLFRGDESKKLVKRIEDDGIAFCQKHWETYTKNMKEGGYIVEPFLPQ